MLSGWQIHRYCLYRGHFLITSGASTATTDSGYTLREGGQQHGPRRVRAGGRVVCRLSCRVCSALWAQGGPAAERAVSAGLVGAADRPAQRGEYRGDDRGGDAADAATVAHRSAVAGGAGD